MPRRPPLHPAAPGRQRQPPPRLLRPGSGPLPRPWLVTLLWLLLNLPGVAGPVAAAEAPPDDTPAMAAATAEEAATDGPAALEATKEEARLNRQPATDHPWSTDYENGPPAGAPFSPGLTMFKALGVLVLLIGLLLLIAALLKKMGFNQGLGGQGELIRVIETRPLGPKKYVAVVEAADEFFLLGVSDQQVNLLTKLQNEPLIRQTRGPSTGSGSGGGFASRLAGAMKKRQD